MMEKCKFFLKVFFTREPAASPAAKSRRASGAHFLSFFAGVP
jgi:hypothetical protein